MNGLSGIDVISGTAAFAVFLAVAAYRLHAHDKMKRGRMLMFMGAAVGVTFSAAIWFPGLYRFTSNGVGFVIVCGLFAWGLVDSIQQVGLGHNRYDKKKTAYAVTALGVTLMLLAANLTAIKASMHNDFDHGSVTQVLSHVEPNGQAG